MKKDGQIPFFFLCIGVDISSVRRVLWYNTDK